MKNEGKCKCYLLNKDNVSVSLLEQISLHFDQPCASVEKFFFLGEVLISNSTNFSIF